MRDDLRRFFESYRDAFNRLDAAAISGHFCLPSMIATRAGTTVWTDADQILANMVALCAHYRAHDFVSAAFEPRAFVDQPPDHAVVDVEWTIERDAGRPASRFRTG